MAICPEKGLFHQHFRLVSDLKTSSFRSEPEAIISTESHHNYIVSIQAYFASLTTPIGNKFKKISKKGRIM